MPVKQLVQTSEIEEKQKKSFRRSEITASIAADYETRKKGKYIYPSWNLWGYACN